MSDNTGVTPNTQLLRTTNPLGNSARCCFGRLFWGPDAHHSVIITVAFMAFNLAFGVLSAVVSQFDRLVVHPAVLISVSAAISIFALFFMFSAVTTNPGIVAKNARYTGDLEQKVALIRTGKLVVERVRDVNIPVKYCNTCDVIRPHRSGHCFTCDNCVELFDHHCGIIGACVGRHNIRYFYLFLVTTAINCIWMSAWSFYILVDQWSGGDSSHEGIRHGLGLLCGIMGGMLGCMLSTLVYTYTSLFVNGLTYRESLRYEEMYAGPGGNPFDLGCRDNFLKVFCDQGERPVPVDEHSLARFV